MFILMQQRGKILKFTGTFKYGKFVTIKKFLLTLFFSVVVGIACTEAMFLTAEYISDSVVVLEIFFTIIVFDALYVCIMLRNVILNRARKKWLNDAIKVEVLVERDDVPYSTFGFKLRAIISFLQEEGFVDKIINKDVLFARAYRPYVDKKTKAFYSPKYNQILFYEE